MRLGLDLQGGLHLEYSVAVDEAVRAAIPGTERKWLEAGSREDQQKAIDGLRTVVPGGGTNLQGAFQALRALEPWPDNLILITDGLPTRGRKPPGEARFRREIACASSTRRSGRCRAACRSM